MPPTVDAPEVAAILRWWDRHARELPWRRTREPYAVWVAETMCQQTQARRAAARWTVWMERWPTVEALGAASLADVLRLWDGLGYPRRARDLHAAARLIVAEGWPPAGELERLPGVGPYTAAAIRCFAYEHAVLPADTNVRRVLARRFPDGIDTAGDPWRAGQAVMEFGQRICSARRPRCDDGCPVADGCAGPGSPAPARPAGARSPRRYEGSLRQRRGDLLRAVLAHGRVVAADADAAAAASLVADGLARRDGDALIPGE